MKTMRGMSLRQIAKELGISHILLVLWKQGKRSLSPELEARYHQFVTSGYRDGYNNGDDATILSTNNGGNDWIRTSDLALMKRPLCR
jgi:transcriptional regulator with XRE-family HTH domain